MVEGLHLGAVAVVDPGGGLLAALGDVHAVVLPRSALKPAQATGLLGVGLDDVLARADHPDALLSVAASSHSGEPVHVAAVRELLGHAGLDDTALRCTPRLPLGERRRDEHVAVGGGPTAVLADCSGKHAAMLATCVAAGWPTPGYLDPGHPVQQAVRAGVEAVAGHLSAPATTDGCGAPLLPVTVAGLASAGAALADGRVARAMRAHPHLAGGAGRDVTALLGAGLLAKDGAEGVQVLGVPGGVGVALKVADGAGRARLTATTAVLRSLGRAGLLGDVAERVGSALRDDPALADPAVLGGGRGVGAVRPAAALVAGLDAALAP